MKIGNLIKEIVSSSIVEILCVGLPLFIGYLVFLNNAPGLKDFYNTDIQKGFQRGIDVLNGVNSYQDFDTGNMLTQEKVPGFFPLYFFVMAVMAKISNYSFVLFLDNLRYLVFFCYFALGLLIYLNLRKQSKLLAITGMCFFMFNRWVLNDVIFLKQESYVLLILLFSLLLLKKNKYLAFLLFGVATGIKHLTILISPIYLIFFVEQFRKSVKNRFFSLFLPVLFLIPIVVPLIPYLNKDINAVTGAILYNVTREPESGTTLKTGFDKMLVLYNQDNQDKRYLLLLPRIPLVIMLLLATLLLFYKKVTWFQYCALTYGIFVGFNPTIFNQYFMWFALFLPLAFKKSQDLTLL